MKTVNTSVTYIDIDGNGFKNKNESEVGQRLYFSSLLQVRLSSVIKYNMIWSERVYFN